MFAPCTLHCEGHVLNVRPVLRYKYLHTERLSNARHQLTSSRDTVGHRFYTRCKSTFTAASLATEVSDSTERVAPEPASLQPTEQVPRRTDKRPFQASWKKLRMWQKEGKVLSVDIKTSNDAGIIMYLERIRCFMPWALVEPARLEGLSPEQLRDASLWEGKEMQCMLVKVDERKRSVIASEKAAKEAGMDTKEEEGEHSLVGQVVDVVVSGFADFGTFVRYKDPERRKPDIQGLIHVSELSWDPVSHPSNLHSFGEPLKAKVLAFRNGRWTFSLKALQEDPLKQTLDNVLPLNGTAEEPQLEVPTELPQGVEDVLAELGKEPGIEAITIGRQAEETHVVSQDLELWLSKEVVEDGFNLVARAGKSVQEVHVVTKMSSEEMKDAIQRVLLRVV